VANASRHLGDNVSGRQAALKAAGWTIMITGICLDSDPKLNNPETKKQVDKMKEYQTTLDSWYPGVVAEESKAFSERTNQ